MLKLDVRNPELSFDELRWFEEAFRRCARRVLLATTLAGSGHPGGSLSSLSLLLMVYALAKVDPRNPRAPERDRVVVSHGHISPGVYSVLCEYGFFPETPFLMEFRRAGSAFSGHVEQAVPGVEWNTGNLGQGLSAACGMARAAKLKGLNYKVFCLMGDGEQQKGQVIEARRWAVKFGLNNLCVVIDYNRLQIGGDIYQVMPQNIAEEIRATGWNLIEVNGHDFSALYRALRSFLLGDVAHPERPTAILAHTVMGKGVSFMENDAKWHGAPLPRELCKKALSELGFDPEELDQLSEKRKVYEVNFPHQPHDPEPVQVEVGDPILYEPEVKTDCRSAYGNALLSLSKLNNASGAPPKVLGLTCDLESSVKMTAFRRHCSLAFHESGIEEHHTATVAGALSKEGFLVFFSTFGVFGVDEVYNQLRLNALNKTALKVVCTHLGADVGEDGPTHQCVDYLGLLLSLKDFEIYLPADPNQTDRIVRFVARRPGNVFVGMGRSKVPIVVDEEGSPFFGTQYEFVPGRADWIRRGVHGTFVTYGTMVHRCLAARELLKGEGLEVGVLNVASVRPFPLEDLVEAAKIGPIVVVEDHLTETGLGSLCAKELAVNGLAPRMLLKGLPEYPPSGKPDEIFKRYGLDPETLAREMRKLIKES